MLLPLINPHHSPLPGLAAALAEPLFRPPIDSSADGTAQTKADAAPFVQTGHLQQEPVLSALQPDAAVGTSMWDDWVLQPQPEGSAQDQAGPVEITQGSCSSGHQLRVRSYKR